MKRTRKTGVKRRKPRAKRRTPGLRRAKPISISERRKKRPEFGTGPAGMPRQVLVDPLCCWTSTTIEPREVVDRRRPFGGIVSGQPGNAGCRTLTEKAESRKTAATENQQLRHNGKPCISRLNSHSPGLRPAARKRSGRLGIRRRFFKSAAVRRENRARVAVSVYSAARRERIEAAVEAVGTHVAQPFEARIAAEPFRGGVRVLITDRRASKGRSHSLSMKLGRRSRSGSGRRLTIDGRSGG